MATESSVMAVIRASRPSFRNPSDKIAFAVHASFLAAGYSLMATGRNGFSDNPPIDGEEVGIEGWNELEDSYSFVYSKSENGLKKSVLVKCLAIGDALMVDVLNLKEEHKEPIHLQINVKDHLSDGDDHKSNYGEMYKNLKGLVESLNVGVLAKLEPKVESSSSARGCYSEASLPSRRDSQIDLGRIGVAHLSAERSEHRTTNVPAGRFPAESQPLPPGLVYPPVFVPSHGSSDLIPGPPAGFYPDRGTGIGGGMLVGPNDPRWFGTGDYPGSGFPGVNPGIPPGARFDPYGPPDVPGFEPGRFVRQPRRPGGGTHPDLEHFQGPDYI